MQYSEEQSTGDAAEYFFAYQVAKELGWPCRLLGVDIGVDAQVEILDDERQSTSAFIPVQVKGKAKNQDYSVELETRHLAYWVEIQEEVLICVCNIADGRSYYLKASELRIPSDQDSIVVRFDKRGVLLDATAKDRLRDQFGSRLNGPFKVMLERVEQFNINSEVRVDETTNEYTAQEYPKLLTKVARLRAKRLAGLPACAQNLMPPMKRSVASRPRCLPTSGSIPSGSSGPGKKPLSL